jgi:cob(I)alamin adenosyltransferase
VHQAQRAALAAVVMLEPLEIAESLVPPEVGGSWGYPSGMPRIYTRTGDDGTTGLLYGGRMSKADPVAEAVGALDELVAALGMARSQIEDAGLAEDLLGLQRELFVVGADLATNPDERARLEAGVSLTTPDMVTRLESSIDDLVRNRPLPGVFVVPGTNPVSAALDLARAVARRAERRVVAVRDAGDTVNESVLRYVNRLSDLLFVLARAAAGGGEPPSRTG